MEEERRYVAENILGFNRPGCRGKMGGGSISTEHSESWFYCDWCGKQYTWGRDKIPPCPKWPAPSFTLELLMSKLCDLGHHVMVRVDPERDKNKFTVIFDNRRIADTEDPMKALCYHLARGWSTNENLPSH